MATPAGFTHTLRRYGLRSAENKTQLETWLDASIVSVGEGNGGQVVSASTNGASFSLGQGMTNAEFANALDYALNMIEKGINSTSRSYGRIC
jgi:hypothetical protein